MSLITVVQSCGHERRLRCSPSTSDAEMERRIRQAETGKCAACYANPASITVVCDWCGKPLTVENPEPDTDYAHAECLALTVGGAA